MGLESRNFYWSASVLLVPLMVLRLLLLVCTEAQFEAHYMLHLQGNHLSDWDQQLQLICLICKVSKPVEEKRTNFKFVEAKNVKLFLSANMM